MGASPDGLVNCSCCIDAVLEIKCPHSIRFEKIENSCGKTSFCLDENKKLKKTHSYYFQVQGLMLVTGKRKCFFFIVYTIVDITIEVILFDEKTCKTIKEKMEILFLVKEFSLSCRVYTCRRSVWTPQNFIRMELPFFCTKAK